MPRHCSVCSSPRRAAIDSSIVAGLSNRAIARQFGIGRDAVRNHRAKHLPRLVARIRDVEEIARATELIADLREGFEDLLEGAHKAMQAGRYRAAGRILQAI